MFVKHGDAELFTLSFGRGSRTLLALGGWAGNLELWIEPMGLLSAAWRTAAYDHRGTGVTAAPVESITFDNMVSDVFAVMDALELDRCVLAAESAGAAVALQAALQKPDRFDGLVLVDGMYFQPGSAGDDRFLAGLNHAYDATLDAFVDLCVPDEGQVAVRRWGRQILARCSQAAAVRLYEAMFGVDLRPRLGQIACPVLVIHGDEDRVVPVDAGRWLASQLPNAELEIIPGAGHVPTLTHAKTVVDAIQRYFDAVHQT